MYELLNTLTQAEHHLLAALEKSSNHREEIEALIDDAISSLKAAQFVICLQATTLEKTLGITHE